VKRGENSTTGWEVSIETVETRECQREREGEKTGKKTPEAKILGAALERKIRGRGEWALPLSSNQKKEFT